MLSSYTVFFLLMIIWPLLTNSHDSALGNWTADGEPWTAADGGGRRTAGGGRRWTADGGRRAAMDGERLSIN